MKKKKRKNKITKADTSDYYTEVFSKGKKLKKTSDKEESTLSDKFQELPWWIPPSGFAIILLILHFTTELGVGYWFFFMMGAALIYIFMVFLIFILVTLGIIRSFP